MLSPLPIYTWHIFILVHSRQNEIQVLEDVGFYQTALLLFIKRESKALECIRG